MIKSLWLDEVSSDTANVFQLMEGHQHFLDVNTGLTDDAQKQHYVFNPDYVLANNRHFIAASQMEAQPNGDATTEGQSVQVMGYCYAYLATKDEKWLDLAKKCWDAYFKFFYWGQEMPKTPQMFICNWIINGKEPILANWPIDRKSPTHSGFKEIELEFNNGITQIEHDGEYYGQFLDKATFAFDGALAWGAINASVKGLRPDGSIDWNKDGVVYPVDWIVNWESKKIDFNGDVLEEGLPESQRGMVKLQDETVNGKHKMNWANRQPVEFGGEMIERNQPWHNRPLNVPVPPDYLGNAADAELWWADACYLMWKITGEQKYWMGWQCALETCRSYSNVDLYDKFFRKSTAENTPFTDGISYDYFYPSEAIPNYSRDAEGYIVINQHNEAAANGAQTTLEQQAVWFRAGPQSKLRVQYGGVDDEGGPLEIKAFLNLSPRKVDDNNFTRWTSSFPLSTSTDVKTVDIPFSNLVQATTGSGKDFILADSRVVVPLNTTVSTMDYQNSVVDVRSALVNKLVCKDSSQGVIIGFWLTDEEKVRPMALTYKSDRPLRVSLDDAEGWTWGWNLPATGASWSTNRFGSTTPTLNEWQENEDVPNPPPRPTRFVPLEVKQISVKAREDRATTFSWYAVNEVPARFTASDTYTLLCAVTLSGQKPYTGRIGDVTVIDYKANNLAYTPGTIPFSNISVPGSSQFDGWRGMPYPGYQYPFIYTIDQKPGEWNTHMENMVNMLWDSQVAYTKKFGVVGPGMSAYIWNRWDNLKYGKPDTWTMYHWGDGTAWSGYQPRAMMGACRAWYELMLQGKPIPTKLKDYSENWIKWLIKFVKDSGGITPTDFPPESLPKPDPTDFTGHMCGLWLAGACLAKLAGSKVEGLDFLIESCVDELQKNFVNTGIPNMVMNGSWSPAIRLGTGTGPENNGMFFGFWSGEILRGLGLYMLTKQLNVGDDMYAVIKQ